MNFWSSNPICCGCKFRPISRHFSKLKNMNFRSYSILKSMIQKYKGHFSHIKHISNPSHKKFQSAKNYFSHLNSFLTFFTHFLWKKFRNRMHRCKQKLCLIKILNKTDFEGNIFDKRFNFFFNFLIFMALTLGKFQMKNWEFSKYVSK